MKVEESLNVTFDESPPPTKLSPLVDDYVGEEEAVENKVKVDSNIENESLKVDEVVNIKESKNHPLHQYSVSHADADMDSFKRCGTSYTFDVGYRVLRDLILHRSSINNSASLSNRFEGFYFIFKFGIWGLLRHVVIAITDRIRVSTSLKGINCVPQNLLKIQMLVLREADSETLPKKNL
ncbi:hypothetical protein Tco_0010629 [Tanacetum coccineum]